MSELESPTSTTNALFVLERIEPLSIDDLIEAGDELQDKLRQIDKDCVISTELVSRGS